MNTEISPLDSLLCALARFFTAMLEDGHGDAIVGYAREAARALESRDVESAQRALAAAQDRLEQAEDARWTLERARKATTDVDKLRAYLNSTAADCALDFANDWLRDNA